MIWCIKTYIIAYVKIKKIKIYYPVCQTYSPTGVWNRFPKGGPTCRRQVVNPQDQTSQGQSVAKPETPLQKVRKEPVLMHWYERHPHTITNQLLCLAMCLRHNSSFHHPIAHTNCEHTIQTILKFYWHEGGNHDLCSEAASVQSTNLQSIVSFCTHIRSIHNTK